MQKTEFLDLLGKVEVRPEGFAAFAGKLVEAGVLEADDNPQQRRRRVEVEGVEVEGPDEDGDLTISSELSGPWYADPSEAGPLARALLAWVAAGEEQERPPVAPEAFPACNAIGVKVDRIGTRSCAVSEDQGSGSAVYLDPRAIAELYATFCPQEQPQAAPEPAQGTRERPYVWKRRTESGGTEEVPVWLKGGEGGVELHAGVGRSDCLVYFWNHRDKPRLATDADDYLGPKDDQGRALFLNFATPPQPQPETGEMVLRLTREEAEALRQLIDDKVGGPPSGPRGLFDRISNKLEGANVRAAEHTIEGPSLYLR